MTRGYYMLSSSMLTQNRTLSTISNNVANVQTAGFKKDIMTSKPFGEIMMNRIDAGSKGTLANVANLDEFINANGETINNIDSIRNLMGNRTELGDVSFMNTVDESTKIHSQGTLIPTERNLDFAIVDAGFFAVKEDVNKQPQFDENGEVIVPVEGEQPEQRIVYTRGGSFNLDAEGFLILEGTGRVQDENGDIFVGTDKFGADEAGNLLDADNEIFATIPLFDFPDYDQLITVGEGFYMAEDREVVENPRIQYQTVEGSNVDVGQEMTNQIASQRVLQNVSQALKMYDQTLQSATTQIGRL